MARYIKYVGTSQIRQITKDEWASLDPPVKNVTLRWNVANGWTIPADMVSEHAWPYIEADPELILIDKDYRGLAEGKDAEASDADPVLFPSLISARTAEMTPEFQPGAGASDEAPSTVEGPPGDQESGAVSVNEEPHTESDQRP